ncbi:APC family permease [Stackebrandtia nassauensis]|uniref:Amino acid transporter n=1 Tax=Stackebrandtia nassauensis (strain DSM 44728 / CIP 108903 / NRRL B-16338 / NBRC 102104 / LLR-40K-21) TaxID=446470 RepID=D3Q5C2_STANL|nr:APC family permease [Stackebrandtia nassauensis]ADD44171.1 amino acid transporter [Stackebrandtia nassauensis DSM 44728]
MARPTSVVKRLLLGRPFHSERLSHTLLPKRIALPVFSSDPLSSVAYAPEQIFLTLSVAGTGAYIFSGWVGLFIALVMIAVVASYRQNVNAYPSGGGDYEVATVNHSPSWGLVVASALLVDYILTVAVSISAAAANIGSAVPFVNDHKILFSVVAIALLTAINLRGMKESGAAFAIPTYAFVVGIFALIVTGLFRYFVMGDDLRAASADFDIVDSDPGLAGAGLVFLLLRTFASGCAALTGVEAIANGVPAFKPPKGRNAATTLLMMGILAISMFMGLIALARITEVKMAEHPDELIGAPNDYIQETLLVQLSRTVFDGFTPGFVFVTAVTGLILVLAANTAFNGFPVLGSILAQDRYLPRQLHTRGDKLAFSNGIILLALFAVVLVLAFGADEHRLIQLYIVGVFVSFVLSQSGMIRHWNRLLRTERDKKTRLRMRRSQVINSFGLLMTASVLVIVIITKFSHGAWISIVAMAVLFVIMRSIRRHYRKVSAELNPPEGKAPLPSRNHVIVLVSKVHQPMIRALTYAKATRPDTLTALTVNVDDSDTRELQAEWDRRKISIPLTVVDSPYREITGPIVDYVKSVKRKSPREVVTVFIPEYVVGHWWENLLHNQSALRIKSRLRFEPGVMVTSVPWQLASSEGRNLDKLDSRLTGRS